MYMHTYVHTHWRRQNLSEEEMVYRYPLREHLLDMLESYGMVCTKYVLYCTIPFSYLCDWERAGGFIAKRRSTVFRTKSDLTN